LKIFQLESVEALHLGKGVIIVQHTGAGKLLCYVVPALLNSGRLTLVIEPVVAIISDQLNTLTCKGIDAVVLSPAAGKKGIENFIEFSKVLKMFPYLHSVHLNGTSGNDRMPSFRSAFDELKRLKELNCPILAMSATVTSRQADSLKAEFLRGDNCITVVNSVHRSNLKLQLS